MSTINLERGLFKKKIILQSVGSYDAIIHFQNTIENKVALANLHQHLSLKQYNDLTSIFKDGYCFVWGVKGSAYSSNFTNFRELRKAIFLYLEEIKSILLKVLRNTNCTVEN